MAKPLGAGWAFSFQQALLSDNRPRFPLTGKFGPGVRRSRAYDLKSDAHTNPLIAVEALANGQAFFRSAAQVLANGWPPGATRPIKREAQQAAPFQVFVLRSRRGA